MPENEEPKAKTTSGNTEGSEFAIFLEPINKLKKGNSEWEIQGVSTED